MKKTLWLSLVAMGSLLSLSACGKEEKKESVEITEEIVETEAPIELTVEPEVTEVPSEISLSETGDVPSETIVEETSAGLSDETSEVPA